MKKNILLLGLLSCIPSIMANTPTALQPTTKEEPKKEVKVNPLFEKRNKQLESSGSRILSTQDNANLERYQSLSSQYTLSQDYYIFKNRIGSLTNGNNPTITMFFQYNNNNSYQLYKALDEIARTRNITLWLIPMAYGRDVSHARLYYGLENSISSTTKLRDVNERLMFDTTYSQLNPTDLKQLSTWLGGQNVDYTKFSEGYGSGLSQTQALTVLSNINHQMWFVSNSPSFYVNGKYYFPSKDLVSGNSVNRGKLMDLINLGLLGDKLSY